MPPVLVRAPRQQSERPVRRPAASAEPRGAPAKPSKLAGPPGGRARAAWPGSGAGPAPGGLLRRAAPA
eukprot:7243326-Alexandrium_andersonii.AAC.1